MKIDALARLERYAKRIAEIAAVLGKYGLADLFGGFKHAWLQDRFKSADGQSLTEGVTQAARARMALTELGTTFIKLGQMLSTRADLLGPELTEELSQLQANVPPDAASVARATIEKELGHPIEELFAQFDDEPLAAASVAQVHAALLHTGQSVVVKVRRAGVAEQAATDLEIVQALAELLEKHSPALRAYQPLAVVRQFRRTLLRERSPLFRADRIERPLLIGQGANDPRVKRQESDQIVRAMQAKSLPVTYVLFPDEGHGFEKPENNIAFNAVVEAFLAKHLGGRVEPIGESLSKSSAKVVSKGALELPVTETTWDEVAALDAPVEVPVVAYESLTDAQKQMVDQVMKQFEQVPAEALPQALAQIQSALKSAPAEVQPAIQHVIGRLKERIGSK
jgi:pimeloyl-ACP methyl ester carboxylesterase